MSTVSNKSQTDALMSMLATMSIKDEERESEVWLKGNTNSMKIKLNWLKTEAWNRLCTRLKSERL